MKSSRFSTLALLSVLTAAPPTLAAEDVVFTVLVQTDTEFTDEISANWLFKSARAQNYSISPSGHVSFAGEIENEITTAEQGGSWLLERKIVSGGETYEFNRLLYTGLTVVNTAGNSVVLPTTLPPSNSLQTHARNMHVGENDIGAVPRSPIVYAGARLDLITEFNEPYFAWTSLNPLNRTPLYDNGQTLAADDYNVLPPDAINRGPRNDAFRINGIGSNLIGYYGISGTGLGTDFEGVYTFSAPSPTGELLAYTGQEVPGSPPSTATIDFSSPASAFVNAHRDGFFTAQFIEGSNVGELLLHYDASENQSDRLSVVAQQGETAADFVDPTTVYANLLVPLGLNSFGDFAFTGTYVSTTEFGTAIWGVKNGTTQVLLKSGDAAPDLNDPAVTVLAIDMDFTTYGGKLSENGSFFFLARLQESGEPVLSTLYMGDLDDNYTLIAKSGDEVIGVPGATFNGAFDQIKGPNALGQIVFHAHYEVAGEPGFKIGVFLTDTEHRPHLVVTQGEDFEFLQADPLVPQDSVEYVPSRKELSQIADDGRLVYLARSTQDSDRFVILCANAFLFGDIDQDGNRNADDIDALAGAINASSTDEKYDMNGDGSVNSDDFDYWVDPIARTLKGDTNLDGDVDDSDFGTIYSNYTGPVGAAGGKGWADGDTDGDGDVDDSDIGTAQANYTGPL